jgi:hypothetical protein
MLSLVTAVALCGCRTSSGSSSLLQDAGTTPDADGGAFLQACEHRGEAAPATKQVLDGIAAAAFAGAEPDAVFATAACPAIWQKFLATRRVNVKHANDLQSLEMLEGVADLELFLSIDQELRNPGALRGLDLVSLRIVHMDGLLNGTTLAYSTAGAAALIDSVKTLARLHTLEFTSLGIADFSGLRDLKAVETLSISGSPVTSLDFLGNWTALKRLQLQFTQVAGLEALAGVLQLEELSIWGGDIKAIDALMNLANLRRVELAHVRIASINALQFLPSLSELTLLDVGLTSVAALARLPLRRLDLSINPLTSISPLAGGDIEELTIEKTSVTDLSPAASMAKLRFLDAQLSPVKTLPGLTGSSPLQSLFLKGAQTADYCPVLNGGALATLQLATGEVLDKGAIVARRCPMP